MKLNTVLILFVFVPATALEVVASAQTIEVAGMPALRAAAAKDWDKLGQPHHVRYLAIPADAGVESQKINWRAALSFVVTSSSRSLDLRTQVPVRIRAGLYRIDLIGLKWDALVLQKSLAKSKYPYSLLKAPLVLRGDWLMRELGDASRSDLYLELLLGEVPKDRDAWLKAVAVDRKTVQTLGLDFGQVETKSGVAKNRQRWVEFYARLGGYASGTRDFIELTAENAPLDNLDGKGKHDAEEWIVGIPKTWAGGRGALQVYLLTDGAGKIVGEADAKIVEDTTRHAGIATIRYPGSCHQCHVSGLNEPTANGVRELTTAGVRISALTSSKAEFVERWHLTSSSKLIKRANEDFGDTIKAVAGLEATENAANYRAAIDSYVGVVSREAAARELGLSVLQFREVIDTVSKAGYDVPGQLIGLAAGRPVPRSYWESVYLKARDYLGKVQQNGKKVKAAKPGKKLDAGIGYGSRSNVNGVVELAGRDGKRRSPVLQQPVARSKNSNRAKQPRYRSPASHSTARGVPVHTRARLFPRIARRFGR